MNTPTLAAEDTGAPGCGGGGDANKPLLSALSGTRYGATHPPVHLTALDGAGDAGAKAPHGAGLHLDALSDPPSKATPGRMLWIAMVSVHVMACYYAYDAAAIFSNSIKSNFGVGNDDLGIVFAVYSIPNAVLPLVAGQAFARWGALRVTWALSMVSTAGLILGALATWGPLQSFWLLVASRALYGAGAESSMLGVDVLAAEWCGDDGPMSLAFGIIETGGQLGSILVFFTGPLLIRSFGLTVALSSLGALGVVGLACVTVTALALGAAAKCCGCCALGCCSTRRRQRKRFKPEAMQDLAATSQEGAEAEYSVLTPRSKRAATTCCGCLPRPVPRLRGRRLLMTALVSLAAMCYTSVFYTFQSFAPDFLQETRGLSVQESGLTVGVLSVTSLLLSVPTGWALTKLGGRLHSTAMFGFAVSLGSLLLLEYDHTLNALVGLGGLSIGYLLLPTAIWPLLAKSAGERSFSTVYTAVFAMVNSLSALMAHLIGKLTQAAEEENSATPYRSSMVLFACVCGAGFCFTGAAWVVKACTRATPHASPKAPAGAPRGTDDESESTSSSEESDTDEDSDEEEGRATARTPAVLGANIDIGVRESMIAYQASYRAWRMGASVLPSGSVADAAGSGRPGRALAGQGRRTRRRRHAWRNLRQLRAVFGASKRGAGYAPWGVEVYRRRPKSTAKMREGIEGISALDDASVGGMSPVLEERRPAVDVAAAAADAVGGAAGGAAGGSAGGVTDKVGGSFNPSGVGVRAVEVEEVVEEAVDDMSFSVLAQRGRYATRAASLARSGSIG